MTKVFLSYEREDLATARGLAVALEQNGHEVWWDRHIRGGTQYADEIEKALEAAEAVVVLWSKRSIASAWVRDEAAAGRDTGRLVPVSIDACTPPLGFRQYQTLHLPNGAGGNGAFEDLNETITAMGSGIPHPNRGTERAAPSSRKLTRRHALIAGGSAAAVAAAGGGYWFYERSKQSDIPPEVAPLMLQARQLMNLNTREGQFMALGLYQRVTETVPDWADGWGWLGFTYGVMSHYAGGAESKSFRARAEAAGNRALQINPQSAFGELALGVAYPFIGYYGAREERLNRALSYKPDEDEILLVTAVFLQMVVR